jgi:hypothetical protein
MIQLLPKLSQRDEFYSIKYLPDGSSRDGRFDETVLSPGDWVHTLVGWHSEGYPNWQCSEHSGLKLLLMHENRGMEPIAETSVEVRNLPMRSCILVYVLEYRKGRYSLDSTVPNDWLKFPLAVPGESPSILKQIADSRILHNSPRFQVSSITSRILLGKGSTIALMREPQADNGCDYRMLRMRDSDGTTVISFQNCESIATKLSQSIWNPDGIKSTFEQLDWIDMMPKHAGPVAYDVVANLGNSEAPFLAKAHLDLIAHDPTPPAQAAIVNSLSTCTGSQLQLESPSPVIEEAGRVLRAYDATNTSSQACSLSGVPKLEFLPIYEPCPNCENDLFGLRPNGRIDLQPGQSAHFLVGYKEGASWYLCEHIDKIKLTASDHGKPVTLPFHGGGCGLLDVSAWREGKFDNDPLNIKWAKTHPPSADPTTPIPPDCNKPELLTWGRPKIPMGEGHAFGLSLSQHEFKAGEGITLHIWIDNTGDTREGVMTCMGLDYFKANGFDLYDAYGHRLLRRHEAKMLEGCKNDPESPIRIRGWNCTRNFPIYIPAHTCITRADYDFTTSLTADYDLPPGEYTVRPRQDEKASEDVCKPQKEQPFHPEPGKDLTFSVVQP